MNVNKKMKLSDLQVKPTDMINWATLEEFFYTDAPQTLTQALVLTNVIKDGDVLGCEQIDSSVVIGYLTGMAADTRALSEKFSQMKGKFEHNRNLYKGNYNEDAHMFSLTISFEITEWLEQYEDTVGRNFNDVVDYINRAVPSENKITPPNQGAV